jgi:PIN domain nuclease of toxin-antitoxin system
MTVLDASCVIALMRGEVGAKDIQDVLMTHTSMSVVNRAEVVDKLARAGGSPSVLAADIDMLSIEQVDATSDIADLAARIRARHYHRSTSPISLADCFAVATALQTGAALATSDRALAIVVSSEGGAVVPTRNSSGDRPAIRSVSGHGGQEVVEGGDDLGVPWLGESGQRRTER